MVNSSTSLYNVVEFSIICFELFWHRGALTVLWRIIDMHMLSWSFVLQYIGGNIWKGFIILWRGLGRNPEMESYVQRRASLSCPESRSRVHHLVDNNLRLPKTSRQPFLFYCTCGSEKKSLDNNYLRIEKQDNNFTNKSHFYIYTESCTRSMIKRLHRLSFKKEIVVVDLYFKSPHFGSRSFAWRPWKFCLQRGEI